MDPTTTDRLGAALKGAVDLNLRFYTALLKLSTDYVQSLGDLVSTAGAGAVAAGATASQQPSGAAPPRAGAAPTPPIPPLLLAARAGADAVAAFVVENSLGRAVTARVAVRGEGVAGRAAVRPEVVSLGPGERCAVEVRVPVDASVEAERDHLGELSVPELAGRTIPFVVRRLADPPASPTP
jgi:hypothetical protein